MANYLFNGVLLPALPEWDKSVYPYAYIAHQTDNDYLRLYSEPIYADGNGIRTSTECSGMSYKKTDDEWKMESNSNYAAGEVVGLTIFAKWTNTDILNADGTLYLAASDPIPVPTYDPTALLQGYLVGCRLRAMRGKT